MSLADGKRPATIMIDVCIIFRGESVVQKIMAGVQVFLQSLHGQHGVCQSMNGGLNGDNLWHTVLSYRAAELYSVHDTQ